MEFALATMKRITISIAEDHEVIRLALVKLLNDFDEFRVTINAANGLELLNKINKENLTDILLLDVDMPVMDGIETLKRIRETYGDSMVIIALSMHTEYYIVQYMLEAGANGFISKQVSIEELRDGLLKAAKEKFYLSPSMSKLVFGNKYQSGNKEHDLNKIELEIVKLVCQQKNNKEIGEELKLSPNTVNTYRTRILEKVDAVNTAGLVVYAIRTGLYRIVKRN